MDPNPLWYGGRYPWLARALLPLSWLYRAIVGARRFFYRVGWLETRRLPVPVVVIGNLTVGGTGKTPLTIHLAGRLRALGRNPGILTRGYGGQSPTWPLMARPDSDPRLVGDEAVLLARRSGCPVAVGPDRFAAGTLLLREAGCDLLLTDDGLQHQALARDLEIAVVDGERGLGNGRCLPAGPLREPPSRLAGVDLVVLNGGDGGAGSGILMRHRPDAGVGILMRHRPDTAGGSGMRYRPGAGAGIRMHLRPGAAVNLADPARQRPLAEFRGAPILAIAGIGHPERFFRLLVAQGLTPATRVYPDHHPFAASEVATWVDGPVLMTEKDAVKCAPFAGPDHWYLPVEAALDPADEAELLERILSIPSRPL